jgi:putative endonuclease
MKFYIYILYSTSSNIYYVGYTHDFEQRFIQHNTSDQNTFTSKHRPWQLKAVYYAGTIEAEAMKIEKFIKKQKSRKLIEKLIAGHELFGILAQLIKVPLVRD